MLSKDVTRMLVKNKLGIMCCLLYMMLKTFYFKLYSDNIGYAA